MNHCACVLAGCLNLTTETSSGTCSLSPRTSRSRHPSCAQRGSQTQSSCPGKMTNPCHKCRCAVQYGRCVYMMGHLQYTIHSLKTHTSCKILCRDAVNTSIAKLPNCGYDVSTCTMYKDNHTTAVAQDTRTRLYTLQNSTQIRTHLYSHSYIGECWLTT